MVWPSLLRNLSFSNTSPNGGRDEVQSTPYTDYLTRINSVGTHLVSFLEPLTDTAIVCALILIVQCIIKYMSMILGTELGVQYVWFVLLPTAILCLAKKIYLRRKLTETRESSAEIPQPPPAPPPSRSSGSYISTILPYFLWMFQNGVIQLWQAWQIMKF